jgi:hypothetical protein
MERIYIDKVAIRKDKTRRINIKEIETKFGETGNG